MSLHRNRNTAFSLAALVAGMLMLAYASVPLYRLFCQVTGYGGTTKRAEEVAAEVRDRTVTIRFNTDVAPGLPWKFTPPPHAVKAQVGAQTLVAFHSENLANEPVKGHATYNVTPQKAGMYFSKIECFCFTEQQLEAKQSVDMPVAFFVDPAFADDPAMKDVNTITLSYTFFPLQDE